MLCTYHLRAVLPCLKYLCSHLAAVLILHLELQQSCMQQLHPAYSRQPDSRPLASAQAASHPELPCRRSGVLGACMLALPRCRVIGHLANAQSWQKWWQA